MSLQLEERPEGPEITLPERPKRDLEKVTEKKPEEVAPREDTEEDTELYVRDVMKKEVEEKEDAMLEIPKVKVNKSPKISNVEVIITHFAGRLTDYESCDLLSELKGNLC